MEKESEAEMAVFYCLVLSPHVHNYWDQTMLEPGVWNQELPPVLPRGLENEQNEPRLWLETPAACKFVILRM